MGEENTCLGRRSCDRGQRRFPFHGTEPTYLYRTIASAGWAKIRDFYRRFYRLVITRTWMFKPSTRGPTASFPWLRPALGRPLEDSERRRNTRRSQPVQRCMWSSPDFNVSPCSLFLPWCGETAWSLIIPRTISVTSSTQFDISRPFLRQTSRCYRLCWLP